MQTAAAALCPLGPLIAPLVRYSSEPYIGWCSFLVAIEELSWSFYLPEVNIIVAWLPRESKLLTRVSSCRFEMTSTILAPIEQPSIDPVAPEAVGPPPRKRRRRTAGGGASDDCFACRSHGVKCDRKRPYCTQCIEVGKECSGYKTTLTWGVGVASRGKLRGLSCPIAHKNVDGSDASPVEMESRRRKSTTTKIKKEELVSSTNLSSVPASQMKELVSTSAQNSSLSRTNLPPPAPVTISYPQNGWQMPGFQDHVHSRQAEGVRNLSLEQPSLQHLHTSLGSQYDRLNMPKSGRSVSSYAETEFHSPLEYPHTPSSLPFPEQMSQSVPVQFQDQAIATSSMDGLGMNGTSLSSYVENMSSNMNQSQPAFADNGTMNMSPAELISFNESIFDRDNILLGQLGYSSFGASAVQVQDDELDNDRKDISIVDTRFSSPFFHITPRLQSLMNYYDRNICPYLIAFDGPENPYRKHILQLAIGNDGLQNAIAALSTNNCRMRQKEPRQIGFVEDIMDAFDGSSSKNPNEPSAEESCYKQTSIDQLNMQLTDIRAAQDDSVLATLLILCLFHVCDSGFSKFRTQLAGVQKLLSLRNPNTQSDFTRWVEMFFIWFDVMTSTVNDREMQIKGESLAMLDFSANLGAMEQFSGCDGRLFKLIAGLGRLNLLAQGRPVRFRSSDQQTSHPTQMQRPKMRPMRKKRPSAKLRANKSLSAADYDNIDGNGWGTPIISSDEDADGSADDEIISVDERGDFWTEWQDIRDRLLAWQMDLPNVASAESSNAPSTPTERDASQRDLIHINESFRYSALLYTERLGHPLLPSSHDQFQHLVSRALYHITALEVTSCVNKFLLWPLFIVGTESVDEGHRNIIRNRCREITEESGFFNNISSLWVLEKVWKEVGKNVRGSEADEVKARRRDSEASKSGRYGQAFRWRKAMDRVDGEYIVV